MLEHGSKVTINATAWGKAIFLSICIVFVTVFLPPSPAFCSPSRLVESSDYKDNDFRKGIISDYTDMVEGDDINWVWSDPSEKLAQYKLKLGQIKNTSEIHSKSLVDQVKSLFKDTFADMDTKGNKVLVADVCIYEAQNMSMGKAWIPFVGAHQMQAGIGLEMVLHDKNGKPVAKLRHFAREGVQLEAAAQEVVGDLMKYIANH